MHMIGSACDPSKFSRNCVKFKCDNYFDRLHSIKVVK